MRLIKPNTIQHEQLSEVQLARTEKLQETFAEVDKSSLETWIDNFKRGGNKFIPDICTRTVGLIGAKEDLEYLKGRQLLKGKKSK
jgi:hypothetical protein